VKTTVKNLKNLIQEALIIEAGMKEQHALVDDAVVANIETTPGIDGMSLVRSVMQELTADPEFAIPIDEELVFGILDDLQGEGQIWLDDEEDAWYISGSPQWEEIISMRGQ